MLVLTTFFIEGVFKIKLGAIQWLKGKHWYNIYELQTPVVVDESVNELVKKKELNTDDNGNAEDLWTGCKEVYNETATKLLDEWKITHKDWIKL